MSWTITILLICVSGDWSYSYEHCILFGSIYVFLQTVESF